MIGQLPGQCGQGDHPIKGIICMEMTEKCQDPITSFESLDIGVKIILTFNGRMLMVAVMVGLQNTVYLSKLSSFKHF